MVKTCIWQSYICMDTVILIVLPWYRWCLQTLQFGLCSSNSRIIRCQFSNHSRKDSYDYIVTFFLSIISLTFYRQTHMANNRDVIMLALSSIFCHHHNIFYRGVQQNRKCTGYYANCAIKLVMDPLNWFIEALYSRTSE